MNCRFQLGCRSCPSPAKIICSNFNQAITTSRKLAAIFIIRNPSVNVLNKITIPVVVYSVDISSGVKTNWDIVESGIVLGNNPSITTTVSDTGNFALSNTNYDSDLNSL